VKGIIILDEKIPLLNIFSTGSIFFDPNIYSGLNIICLMTHLFLKTNNRLSIIFILNLSLILVCIVLSWSKFSIILSLLLFSLYLLPSIRKLIDYFAIELYLFLIMFLSTVTLSNSKLFDELLSKRVSLWIISIRGILRNSPLQGYGGSHKEFSTPLFEAGTKHITSHNSLIDIGLMYGAASMVLYLAIVLVTLFVVKKQENFFHKLLFFTLSVFSLINPNNIGGISTISLTYGMLFFSLNLAPFSEDNNANRLQNY